MNYAPVKLISSLKNYLWGGDKLITDFNKKTESKIVAESWELSAHPEGESVIKQGAFSGLTLTEYIKNNGGSECVGKRAAEFEHFPILIKLIDAKDNLSIQVHPDDSYALKVEGQYGKTEMWYVVDCEKDSYLYYGLNCDITKKEFEKHIRENTILQVLNKVSVHKGDVFFIPPGTIHAICSGILICEVQQNSNITYRVYDYNRKDSDGKCRELHIEKAIDVSNLSSNLKCTKKKGDIISQCKYFTVEKIKCDKAKKIKIDKNSFRSLVILSGEGELQLQNEKIEFLKGDSIFIPAQEGELVLRGYFEAVLSYL